MNRFDVLVQRVIDREGGYVAHKRDPGGATKYGISQRAYPDEDIPALSIERAKTLYRMDYWNPIQGDELPAPIDEYLFDYAVNSGVERASIALQAAVGSLQDGWIGPRTLEALKLKRSRDVLRLLFVDRAMTYALNPNDKIFGRGWFARLFDLTEIAFKESA